MKNINLFLKIITALSLTLLISGNLNAQNANVIDSLKKVIHDIERSCPTPCAEDTSRINAYFTWYDLIKLHKPDSALVLMQQSKRIIDALINSKKNILSENKANYILATILNNLGYINYNLGNISDAMNHCNLSLKINRRINNKDGEATALLNLGHIMQVQGNIDKSLEYFNQCLKIRNDLGDKRSLASVYSSLANIWKLKGEVSKTLEVYNKSLTLYDETGDIKGKGVVNGQLGAIYTSLGKYDSAMIFLNKSLSYALEINNKNEVSINYYKIGAIHENQGNMSEAIEYYQKSLKVGKEINSKSIISSLYAVLGKLYADQGKYNLGLEYSNKGLDLMLEMDNKMQIATCYNNIGSIYNYIGDISSSLKYINKSIKMLEELDNKRGLAYTYFNAASIYTDLGKVQDAADYYEKSLKYFKEIKNIKGMAYAYNGIGRLYGDQGDYDKCLEYSNKSLAIREQLGDKKDIANSVYNIGLMYYYKANKLSDKDSKDSLIQKAFNSYNKSLKIQEEIKDQVGKAFSLHAMGITYYYLGNVNKAIEYYQKALQLRREINHSEGIAYTLHKLSTVSQKKNDCDEFKKYAIENYQISKKLGVPTPIQDAAIKMKDLYLAEELLEKADSFAMEVIGISNRSIISNFAILPETGQEKYFNKVSEHYMDFNSYALYRKRTNPQIAESVYNNTLKNKGLILKSSVAMRNAVHISKDSVLIDTYYKWIRLNKKIAGLNGKGNDTRELESQANEYEKILVKGSKIFSDYKNVQNISWKNVKNSLKQDEVAIEFVHFKYKNYESNNISDFLRFTDTTLYCALIIKKESQYPEMIPLFEEKQLEKILEKFAGNNYNYINNIYGKSNKVNTELYKLIWEPMEDYLKNIKTIYLSPSGLLHKVSFAAIAKEQNIFLCDKYNIEIKSNTAQIIKNQSSNQNPHITTATLFGGINYDTDSTQSNIWKYLEGTKKEVEKVENILKKENINVNYFTSNKATEEEFKLIASNSDILHIATHGFFYPNPDNKDNVAQKEEEYGDITFRGGTRGFGVNSFVKNKNPLMRSGLVLAGANDVWARQNSGESEDGVLTAQEIAHIDMRNTKLVVMSACETGLGDIKGSEGVYGLQRAFKMAGVKKLIMSLWQIPDKETEEFMISFYSNFLKQKDIQTAFNQTQKEMRKKYDPYFWAAFILLE